MVPAARLLLRSVVSPVVLLSVGVAAPRTAVSQQADTARARAAVTVADSAKARLTADTVLQPPNRQRPQLVETRGRAPLSNKRAFLYSLAIPGLGQSRLDRGSAGALFASVELGALVMLRRTAADAREARRYLTDTIPDGFTVAQPGAGGNSTVRPSGTIVGPYTSDLLRARRLHAEDWIAVLAFNHLFAGADAFVSAQLWDMPVKFTALPGTDGPVLVATVRF